MKTIRKVLIIKYGGVGEMVLAFPAFERIRQAHPRARITLLTTEAFVALAKSSPYFDHVEPDGAPKDPASWLALVLKLRSARYDRIYDLQNDARTNLIFQALRPGAPEWSGTALGAGLPHRNRDRKKMHPLERQADQLKDAGIWPDAPSRPLSAAPPDIAWVLAKSPRPRSVNAAGAQPPVVILAPAGPRRELEKRWPIERYADLARRLQEEGFDIVIVGALDDAPLAHAIQRKAPRARDLTGRNDLVQIAALGGRAALAVGNDLAALHLIAAAGAPTIALFSSASDPAVSAPRGHVTVLHAARLAELPADTVVRSALALARQPA
jgi:ADP-heptose:LPS heptosyltransferase